MNKILILKKIENIINENPIFKKYNNHDSLDLLKEMQLNRRLNHFSWGLLYLSIRSFYEDLKEDDFFTASNIENLCLSSKILDDILDSDSDLNKKIDEKNMTLLFTDLLVDSLIKLSPLSNYNLAIPHLQTSIQGEWADVNIPVTTPGVDEEFYFKRILTKTTAIVKFISTLAVPADSLELWYDFSDHFGAALQINNDIRGIFMPSKNDIENLRATLPLIKFFEIAPHSPLDEGLKSKIIESGAIEYCHFIVEVEKEKTVAILNGKFPTKTNLTTELLCLLPR